MTTIRRFTLAALLISIEFVLAFVPGLGFIPLGFVNATTLHLPVILAGILLGKREGMMLGFIFGCISLFNATVNPNVTSFIFSPFIEVGGIHGNFASVIIALVPRILLGYLSAAYYKKLTPVFQSNTSAILTSFLATLTHTLLVLLGIAIFFAKPYQSVFGLSGVQFVRGLATILAVNGVSESLAAAIILPMIVRIFRKRGFAND